MAMLATPIIGFIVGAGGYMSLAVLKDTYTGKMPGPASAGYFIAAITGATVLGLTFMSRKQGYLAEQKTARVRTMSGKPVSETLRKLKQDKNLSAKDARNRKEIKAEYNDVKSVRLEKRNTDSYFTDDQPEYPTGNWVVEGESIYLITTYRPHPVGSNGFMDKLEPKRVVINARGEGLTEELAYEDYSNKAREMLSTRKESKAEGELEYEGNCSWCKKPSVKVREVEYGGGGSICPNCHHSYRKLGYNPHKPQHPFKKGAESQTFEAPKKSGRMTMTELQAKRKVIALMKPYWLKELKTQRGPKITRKQYIATLDDPDDDYYDAWMEDWDWWDYHVKTVQSGKYGDADPGGDTILREALPYSYWTFINRNITWEGSEKYDDDPYETMYLGSDFCIYDRTTPWSEWSASDKRKWNKLQKRWEEEDMDFMDYIEQKDAIEHKYDKTVQHRNEASKMNCKHCGPYLKNRANIKNWDVLGILEDERFFYDWEYPASLKKQVKALIPALKGIKPKPKARAKKTTTKPKAKAAKKTTTRKAKPKAKTGRKAPTISATRRKIGTRMRGNDGKMWEVKKSGKSQRWMAGAETFDSETENNRSALEKAIEEWVENNQPKTPSASRVKARIFTYSEEGEGKNRLKTRNEIFGRNARLYQFPKEGLVIAVSPWKKTKALMRHLGGLGLIPRKVHYVNWKGYLVIPQQFFNAETFVLGAETGFCPACGETDLMLQYYEDSGDFGCLECGHQWFEKTRMRAENQNWGGNPEGQLAQALERARTSPAPPPLEITELPKICQLCGDESPQAFGLYDEDEQLLGEIWACDEGCAQPLADSQNLSFGAEGDYNDFIEGLEAHLTQFGNLDHLDSEYSDGVLSGSFSVDIDEPDKFGDVDFDAEGDIDNFHEEPIMVIGESTNLPDADSWIIYMHDTDDREQDSRFADLFFVRGPGQFIRTSNYQKTAKVIGGYAPFQITQNLSRDGWLASSTTIANYNGKHDARSLSVGDVVCDADTGRCFIVANSGYLPLEPSELFEAPSARHSLNRFKPSTAPKKAGYWRKKGKESVFRRNKSSSSGE